MKFCVYFKLRTKACITYLLNCVKYLGIHVCKDPMEQQLLNFSSKLHKTKSILNMWLQRHRSIIPSFDEKMIIFGSFSHNSKFNIINLFILLGKFHIHKVKMSKATPSFPLFLIELKIYFESLSYVESNKNAYQQLNFIQITFSEDVCHFNLPHVSFVMSWNVCRFVLFFSLFFCGPLSLVHTV